MKRYRYIERGRNRVSERGERRRRESERNSQEVYESSIRTRVRREVKKTAQVLKIDKKSTHIGGVSASTCFLLNFARSTFDYFSAVPHRSVLIPRSVIPFPFSVPSLSPILNQVKA